jgi:predicted RNA binding protein YcfA (HicA-like mRNA interferase family)
MPKKIRELKALLKQAGFRWRSGKGSHTIWEHPLALKSLTLSGNDGQDAKRYQENEVTARLNEVRTAKK